MILDEIMIYDGIYGISDKLKFRVCWNFGYIRMSDRIRYKVDIIWIDRRVVQTSIIKLGNVPFQQPRSLAQPSKNLNPETLTFESRTFEPWKV